MRKVILPPDAFEEIAGWCHSTEPDDAAREEHDFPEFDDFRERCELDARYDAEERFAELMELNERAVGL